MPSLNKVILIGNMTADPELKQTTSGVSVVSFRIGVQRRFKDANGEYPTDFISIVAWRQTAEFVSKYFKKGSPIVVCGSLQERSYTDQQGNKRYVTEVAADEVGFAGTKADNAQAAPAAAQAAAAEAPKAAVPYAEQKPMAMPPTPEENFTDITDDDNLPF